MNSPTINQANDHTTDDDFGFQHVSPLGFDELCLRTLAPGTIEKCQQLLSDFDLVHGVLGFCSELEELQEALASGDTVNIAEEVGDVMWYVYLMAREMRFDLMNSWAPYDVVIAASTLLPIDNLYKSASAMCDTMKRRVYYLAPTDTKNLSSRFSLILISLQRICYQHKLSLHECQAKVIRKLAKRYPESFSDLHAANRDLQSERAALES